MYKDTKLQHSHSSRLEEEYFMKKERELINRIKKREQERMEQEEKSSHIDRCSFCGTQMEHCSAYDVDILYCHGCESVHMNLGDIEALMDSHHLRQLISDLRGLAKTKKTA